MNEESKEKAALQWHPAFYAGIQIELAEDAHHLSFENEHQLGTKPKEMNFWLHHLTNDLKKVEEAENLLREYKNYKDDNLHQWLMDIIVQANKEVFKEARGKQNAFLEMVRDGFITDQEAAKRLNMTEAEILNLL